MLQATERLPAKITDKTDVYSFGILMWEILTKKKAFAHHSMHGSFNHFRQAILIGERPPIPSYCLPKFRSLLQNCWAAVPTNRPSFKEIVEELHDIVKEYKQIEVQQEIKDEIGDAGAASFWYDAFGSKENIQWPEFCDAFCSRLACDFLREDSIPLKCLREILIGRSNNEISRKKFGSIFNLFDPVEFPYLVNGNHFLDRIVNIFKFSYFFGCIDSRNAEIILRNDGMINSYLLRISSDESDNNCNNVQQPKFCISYLTENHVTRHAYFTFSNGSFYYNNNPFQSLTEIVDMLHLRFPCNTDKYVDLTENLYQSKIRNFVNNVIQSNLHEDVFPMDFMLTK